MTNFVYSREGRESNRLYTLDHSARGSGSWQTGHLIFVTSSPHELLTTSLTYLFCRIRRYDKKNAVSVTDFGTCPCVVAWRGALLRVCVINKRTLGVYARRTN